MNVVIVEDEPLAQLELKRLLHHCDPSIQVLDCLDSIKACVQYFGSHPRPDLVFMDIQLSDGLSFEIFQQITLPVPIIFTTAYDQYAIEAFKVNGVDYLLKPIEPTELQASLQKLEDLKQVFQSPPIAQLAQQMEQLLLQNQKRYKTRFVTKVGELLKHITIEEVAYFYAEDKLVFLVTHDGSEHSIDHTLDSLDSLLDPQLFYRLNRQYLTHLNAIDKISKHFNGRLSIQLRPSVSNKIVISREKTMMFKNWLEGGTN